MSEEWKGTRVNRGERQADAWETVKVYENGKYELQAKEVLSGYDFRALRYGEPWRTFVGDNFLNIIFNDLKNLHEAEHSREMTMLDTAADRVR